MGGLSLDVGNGLGRMKSCEQRGLGWYTGYASWSMPGMLEQILGGKVGYGV